MCFAVAREDICDASGPEFVMCPECDRLCDYGNLSDSCHYARFTRVFDNYATIAMAVFMSAWGACVHTTQNTPLKAKFHYAS